jgi:murein DD-endopeptidase MepM/ murein hydrolase activator NlpD
MGKYFTFLYVPETNDSPKPIRVPRWMVYGLAGATLSVVIAGAALAPTVYRNMKKAYRLARVEREKALLEAQLRKLDQEVSQLERQVRQNFDFQKKARILANLDEIPEEVTQVGIGGTSYRRTPALGLLDRSTARALKELRDEVDRLARQARLQAESYQEILRHLSEGADRLRRTPSIRPVPRGFLSSRFGRRMDPFTGRRAWHRGIDYSVRMGTPVVATADGVVTYAGRWSKFGLMVEVSHGYGFVTRYAHLSKILVRKGQRVRRGDVIGRAGNTGRSTASHLHYEVLRDGKHQNPLAYVLPDQEIVF